MTPTNLNPRWAIPAWELRAVREEATSYLSRPTIHCSNDLSELMADELENTDREVFGIIALDTKMRVIGLHIVSVGSLTAAIVHPREVFKFLISANASSFFAVHNHPSGDPTPSTEDQIITRKLTQAGEILGIHLTDHVVIGLDSHYSFADSGNL